MPDSKAEIQKFKETIDMLRDPDKGCPWNIEQTHGSLKRYLIEEMYECLEAIDAIDELENDKDKKFTVAEPNKAETEYYNELKEELGDLQLQILLHAKIAEEKGYFNFEDLAQSCNEKMITRHPHVFADVNVKSSEEVDIHWEASKKKEKAQRKSIFDGIPKEMPALARAWKISKKAVRESFEWDHEQQLWLQLNSEIDELKEAVNHFEENKKANKENLYEPFTKEDVELEIGDILFTVVNLARWFKVDPEDSLRKTTNKFIKRFNKMVEIAASEQNSDGTSKTLKDYKSTELEELWQKAKKALFMRQ